MRLGRLLAGVAAAGVVAWSWRAARRGDHPLDDLGEAMRSSHGPRVDRALAVATDVGSVFGLAGTSGSLALGVGLPVALEAAGAGGVGWVLGQGAKPLMERPRPWQTGLAQLLVHPPSGSSWPSGHMAVASAVATVASSRGPRTSAAAWLLAATVGGTRVHVGAHHPTDVVAGTGIGVLSGLAWQAVTRVTRHFRDT